MRIVSIGQLAINKIKDLLGNIGHHWLEVVSNWEISESIEIYYQKYSN